MNILWIILIIIAVLLLLTGGLIEAVKFLLWVGIAVLILAAILALVRYIGGGRL